MKTIFGNSGRIVSGILTAAIAVMIAAPAQAQGMHRNPIQRTPYYGGYNRHYYGGTRYYGGPYYGGYRYYGGPYYGGPYYGGAYYGGAYVDGGLILGLLGLGLMVDAFADSQQPAVVYQPQPAPQPQQQYQNQPSDPQEYPPPRKYYPECKEFLGNPGAMAFCEKGVLERMNEEQRLLEQKAYEAGRGK